MKPPYILLSAAVLLTAAGHFFLKKFSLGFSPVLFYEKKYAEFIKQFLSPFFLTGFFLMAAVPLFYFKALESLELSTAYSFTAINQITVSVTGIAVFKEKLDILKVSGIVLIAAGVLVWNL